MHRYRKKQDRTDVCNKCRRTGSLDKGYAMIAGVGIGYCGYLPLAVQSKFTGVNNDTAECCTMTAEEVFVAE